MAATVPSEGICLWPGTDAALTALANWSRIAAYDGRYGQGSVLSGFSPTNGGSATHGHTVSGTHEHVSDHEHVFDGAGTTSSAQGADTSAPDVLIGAPAHGHVNATSATTTINYDGASITINDSTDEHPKFARMIFMGPSDGLQDIPDDTVCFGDSATLPTGFSKANGTGTTAPDLNGRFLRGAAAGGDGGATGGADTHAPTSPSHTHTFTSLHAHAATLCGELTVDAVIENVDSLSGRSAANCLDEQHHLITLTSAGTGGINGTAVTVEAASSEPAFVKLLALENTSGAATTPDGVIIGFTGTSIPSNWALCDGTGGTQDCTTRQILCTTVDGEIGSTGGSNIHGHNLTDHNHTHTGSHNHPISPTQTSLITVEAGATNVLAKLALGHGLNHTWTVSSVTPTIQNATGLVTSSGDDVRQLYRTILWIKKVAPVTSKHFMAGTLWGPTNALAA